MGCAETREPKDHTSEYLPIPPTGPGAIAYNLSRLNISNHQPKTLTTKSNQLSDYLLPVFGVSYDLYPFKSTFKKYKDDDYYDPDFQANYQSIQKNVDNVEWKHPWDFMDAKQKSIQVFEDLIEPNDIQSGDLQDYAFLSVLAAIAENHAELIRRLFITQKFSPFYCIYLNEQGHFKQIIIDDRIPCFLDGGPMFARCNGNELWVVLIEKAYAKLYGTYKYIEANTPIQAFRDLLGAPCQIVKPQNKENFEEDELWFIIDECIKLKYIAMVNQSNQYLCIADAKQIKGADDKNDKLIKLRNIWKLEIDTSWNYDSLKWTDDLFKDLQVDKEDKSILWLSIKDLIKQFKQIHIAKVHPNYFYSSYKCTDGYFTEQTTKRLMLFKSFHKSHGFVTISQKHSHDSNYSTARIIIGRVDVESNKITEFEAQKMEVERDLTVECNFKEGLYIIYMEIDWIDDKIRDISLSAYTQNQIMLIELEIKPHLAEQILDALLQVNTTQNNEQCKDFGDGVQRKCGFAAGYVFYSYSNESVATHLTEHIEVKDLENLQLQEPDTNANQHEFVLKPQECKVIKYKVENASKAFNYQSRFQSSVQQNFTNEHLITFCKTKPEKIVQRKLKGDPIEVGTALLYQNKTEKAYIENLKLKLKNLRVEVPENAPNNLEEEPLRIFCRPGQDQLVSLKIIDSKKQSSYSMSMTFILE